MDINNHQFTLTVYFGEKRILIVPVIDHKYGYSIYSDWFVSTCNINSKDISNCIIKAFHYMEGIPPSELTPAERDKNAAWRKCSKYKTWNSFWKNNLMVLVEKYSDGHFEVQSIKRSEKHKGEYEGILTKKTLPYGTPYEDLGKYTISAFESLEEYCSDTTIPKRQVENIKLLSGGLVEFTVPKDDHFVDGDDFGVGEIYKGYSYLPKEDADSVAEMFLGIGAELDCNLHPDNIKKSWEAYHGAAISFSYEEVSCGIFTASAELRNKDTHKVSYFLKIDDNEIFECSLEVNKPNMRKKTDEKLRDIFNAFAKSCKFLSQDN